VLFPYRRDAQSRDDWLYHYEKILVERAVMSEPQLEAVVLRLPKVYGPNDNAALATVYDARDHPEWRWTHGYVENIAAAIVLAAVHPGAAGQIYNVGERDTPTVGARLRDLPPSAAPSAAMSGNFSQDIAYDTSRIRQELGYEEPVPYSEGLRRTMVSLKSGLPHH
jgi:nucleoside-diphosphate-sugar epimerase